MLPTAEYLQRHYGLVRSVKEVLAGLNLSRGIQEYSEQVDQYLSGILACEDRSTAHIPAIVTALNIGDVGCGRRYLSNSSFYITSSVRYYTRKIKKNVMS